MKPAVGRLHCITDVVLQQRFEHAELARRFVDGGADVVQVRDKRDLGAESWRRIVAEVVAAVDGRAVVVVNDAVEQVVPAGAGGAHVGRLDAPAVSVRARLGPDRLVGRTANSLQEARDVASEPIDYLGVGPAFGTTSKADPAPTLGLEGLAAIASAVPLPIVAIGGVAPERVAGLIGAGVHGIAVLSAVACADRPERAAERFRRYLDDALREISR